MRAWAKEAVSGSPQRLSTLEAVSHIQLSGLSYSDSLLTSCQTLQGGPGESERSEFCHRLKKQHPGGLRVGPVAKLGADAHHVVGLARPQQNRATGRGWLFWEVLEGWGWLSG